MKILRKAKTIAKTHASEGVTKENAKSGYLKDSDLPDEARKTEDSTPEPFSVGNIGEPEFVPRSVHLQKGIAERFDRLSRDNWKYSKKVILNQLLADGLEKYGY